MAKTATPLAVRRRADVEEGDPSIDDGYVVMRAAPPPQESGMGDLIAGLLVGAVIGGVAGYLFFTDHGRSVRRQIEPALEDLARELSSFRSTVQKAAGVANEGWRLLNDAIGEENRPRYPTPHQTSPF